MSPIPAAVDRILALCQGSPDLAGVQILDGQPSVRTDRDVILIGFSPDRLAVEGEIGITGLSTEREQFDIICLASSASGDAAFKPLRDRAFELFETVRSLIADDRRLGGAVVKAGARTTAYAQEHLRDPETGISTSSATVEFVVTCFIS